MIVRDHFGIVVQHAKDDPTDESKWDGGDSCARTGILALDPENKRDQASLRRFLTCGHLVRHPFEEKFNKPSLTSRDNLVQYCASLERASYQLMYLDKWFINKDFLDPAVRLYLYRCSYFDTPWHIALLGNIWMYIALWWNCSVRPNEEMNQFCCMALKAGTWWVQQIYIRHPGIEKNIREYWGGWRDQAEIGECLIDRMRVARGKA